jgi:predicted metal-dependent hydrolase
LPASAKPESRTVFLAAAREINSGRYFEAHEVLEEGLDELEGERWDLAVGLIQIAVGYHKVSQGLWSGALGMLEKGLAKIADAPAVVDTLLVGELRSRAMADVEALKRGEGAGLLHGPPRWKFSR